jgi:hypothetical protein
LPTDLKKNPLKTIAPAIAEPIMFLSNATCVNTSVSTNVIAAVAMAKGIQCLMAVEN